MVFPLTGHFIFILTLTYITQGPLVLGNTGTLFLKWQFSLFEVTAFISGERMGTPPRCIYLSVRY